MYREDKNKEKEAGNVPQPKNIFLTENEIFDSRRGWQEVIDDHHSPATQKMFF